MELGDLVSACNELEEITAGAKANPVVLSLRYSVYAKAQKWDMAFEVADGLAAMVPDKPECWINLAYSARRKIGGSIPEAKRILLVAQVKFPKHYLFPFNLACYCSQLREFKEAENWLKKAMTIDEKAVQKLAVEDEDLKPLWSSMGGTIWKKE
jgi:predicted Zn-dependent protease